MGGGKVVFELVLASCLAGLPALFVFAVPAQLAAQKKFSTAAGSPQFLTPNVEVEKEIRGSETHLYNVKAEAGDCVRLIVWQKGIDVTVSAKNSDGKILTEVDRPNGSVGRETATFIPEETGAFIVEVSGYNRDLMPNKYSILLKELSPPTEVDRRRIVGEKLTSEGESLRFGGESKADAQLLAQAFAKFKAARAIWEKSGDAYEQSVVDYGLGWTYIPQGKYDEATLSFARGLKTAQSLGDEFAQTIDYAGIGWAEFYSGNYETAIFNFNLALETARRNNYQNQVARALFGLGNVAYMSGNYDAAFNLLTECVQVRRKINERNQENLTNITIAKVLLKQKRETSAIDYLNQTLFSFKESKNKKGEGEAVITLGWAHLQLGENQKAIENFELALEIRSGSGDKAGEAAALRGLSVAHARAGDFEKARAEAKKMFAALESLRGESLSADTRLAFAASIQEYYEDGIEILMRAHAREPNREIDRDAFDLSERARSRTLLDLIQEKQTNFGKKANPDLLAREQNLRRQLIENLAVEREMHASEKDSTTLKSQRLKIQDLLFLLREVENEINRQSIRNGETFAANPVPLAEIQNLLDDETVLLEYWLGDEQSYLWLVTREKVFSFTLPACATIEKSAAEVRKSLLLQKSDPAHGERTFNQNATQLSRMLLAPALPHLYHQKLLIVLHGALAYVPFAALPESNQPLIARHEISFLPSASVLAFLQRRNKPAFEREVAVFADPIFSADDTRLGKFSVKNQDSAPVAPRLFISRFEAEKIASFAPPGKSLVALDAEASRENVIKTDLSRYRILHFATHAFIDDEEPELSAVMLSNLDENGRRVNGLLRSSEIVNLDLNNEMVVLSGCRTSLGKNVRGEGLLNLSRGFLLAGTERLLISLWEVEDKATAELMARFYRKHLKEKMTASAALRATQLEIMTDSRWRLPFYWATFVLEGDSK